ncbi:UDP-N-acetylmuramoyl-L-alanyl-D-glutamate--2,6-diaminopimelate ligase [Bacillus gobiensis]|uniref:UDP-N-acetylmuramoyl-L-alanyl-D-glutamate--2, 6-diaminopimelate ligase n=1 Tax=Bacillus gobiensis TaxID=1441095 RepID=UPI003D1C4323
MRLKELLKFLMDNQHEAKDISENPEITSLEMDSREVEKGSLFICINGFTVDGHDFAKNAVEKGAAAILAEKPLSLNVPVIVVNDTKRAMAILSDAFYGQPTHHLQLIGVTGTNGKTSTTHMIERILENAGKKTGLIGTMYTKMNNETFDTKNTTPESITLQKTFKKMVDLEVDSAIMEVSSHALDMGRVRGCDYDVAVFTNLTQDHLDYHKTIAEYMHAKGLLFSQLGNSFDYNKPKWAVINIDDPAASYFSKITSARLLTYSLNEQADIMAEQIEFSPNGTTFHLKTYAGSKNVTIPLLGRFNVYNVLAAAAACLAAGVSFDDTVSGIEKLEGVRGRFEPVIAGQDFSVIVDYAHTPDSLENVLKTCKGMTESKLSVVVGCGGDRDKTKRPKMAQIAVSLADEAIFTSDNPRSEDPLAILKDMEDGVPGAYYHSISNREKAIFFAIANAKKGDTVLIAGKGHETYQLIQDKVYEFDDLKVAEKAIMELNKQK